MPTAELRRADPDDLQSMQEILSVSLRSPTGRYSIHPGTWQGGYGTRTRVVPGETAIG